MLHSVLKSYHIYGIFVVLFIGILQVHGAITFPLLEFLWKSRTE